MKTILLITVILFCAVVNGATFKKITELATTTMTNTATDDLIVMVDTSSGPTTYALTFDELDERFFNENYSSTATFDTNVVIKDGNVFTVEASAYLKSYLIMVSPDSSCSACGVDNSDSFTCTATDCP